MIDENKRNIPKKVYIVDYQLEQCEVDGIADARLNALPFNGLANGKLVEYLCIDNLWHEAKEEPRKKLNGSILYQKKNCRFEVLPLSIINDIFGDWNIAVKDMDLFRWLYIDDLLKGGK